jgi:hypothetical protein
LTSIYGYGQFYQFSNHNILLIDVISNYYAYYSLIDFKTATSKPANNVLKSIEYHKSGDLFQIKLNLYPDSLTSVCIFYKGTDTIHVEKNQIEMIDSSFYDNSRRLVRFISYAKTDIIDWKEERKFIYEGDTCTYFVKHNNGYSSRIVIKDKYLMINKDIKEIYLSEDKDSPKIIFHYDNQQRLILIERDQGNDQNSHDTLTIVKYTTDSTGQVIHQDGNILLFEFIKTKKGFVVLDKNDKKKIFRYDLNGSEYKATYPNYTFNPNTFNKWENKIEFKLDQWNNLLMACFTKGGCSHIKYEYR